ncbi:MAG: hypothetical protein E7080_05940 [Bacteroidales bacterium]|nr:hypothetical protein [Bacteroidales bacterium]
MSVKITDLVDEKAIQQLKDLQAEFEATKQKYIEIAKELLNGLKINVEVVGDIDKLNALIVAKTKEASEATEKLNNNIQQQKEIIANTTNTISRKLAEQEKVNKAEREAFDMGDRYKKIMEQVNGTYEQRVKRLVQIENELKANKQAQKDLNDAIEKGVVSQDSAVVQMVELVKKNRELAQAKSNLNTQLKNEEREMLSVKGSYKHLSQQLELLKKAYKDLTKEEADSDFGKEMLSTIQDLDAHLKDLAADMGEFQRNVGNYAIANGELADSLLEVIGLNNQFGSSLHALGQNSAGSFIDGLKVKIKAFGSTLAGILKNKWILSFLGIAGAGAAFKWWYDYNKGLEKATRLTQQFTGLAGDELKTMRTKVASLADAYEKDFSETLIGINAVAKQFGISFEESFELVKDGFIAGADANGEFIENIKEYPAYFKEAGISASEFIAITAQANQAGIYSDKGIDVIKEGNLRIREMTKATAEAIDGIGLSSEQIKAELEAGLTTTFDVMKQISAKLAELPADSAKVGTAIADIFGGPGEDAGLQYLITLKDIDTNLENVKGKAGELGVLQEEQLNSQMALQQSIANLFDATGGTFESFTASIKIFVNQTLALLINVLSKVIKFVGDNKTAFLTFGGIVAGVTAIVNAHNIAMALAALRTKAVAVAQAALNSVISLGRAVLALLTAGYLACTGNIVGATVAMKAFNVAIKSNPIGLLLSGIALLVTALIGLGDATEEATEAEKERQKVAKQAEDRAKQLSDLTNQTASAQISAYMKLKKSWEELGDSFDKKKKFIKENKKSFEELGFSIKDVNTAETFLVDKTDEVVKAFVLRAKAAAYDKVITSAYETMLTEIDEAKKYTGGYTEGDRVAPEEIGKPGVGTKKFTYPVYSTNAGGVSVKTYDRVVVEPVITDIDKYMEAERSRRVASAEDKANQIIAELNDGLKSTQIELNNTLTSIGVPESLGDGGDSTTPTSTIKTEEDIQKQMLQLYKKTVQEKLAIETEGTEEWLEFKEEAIAIDSALQMLAVEESKKQALKDLENSTLTEEEKAQRAILIEQVAKEQILAISEQADLAEEEAAKRVAQYKEELADKEVQKIQNRYAGETVAINKQYAERIANAKKHYAEQLNACGNNTEERERIEREFQLELSTIDGEYAEEVIQKQIDMLNEILAVSNLSAESRLQIEQELANAEMALQDQVTENAIRKAEEQADSDARLTKKRMDNAKKWLEVASDSINAISDLANTLFEGQISKIEEEQEANEEAQEKELERINELEENKVITTEEAEARKRATEAKTAKKNEELEKKKQALEYKQAVWQKATDLAQAGISTALGIMQTIASVGFPAAIPMIAVVSALGAIQMATIAATPIPKYAKGTGANGHPGGFAIVGDGGKQEVVLFDNKMWITPDTPTFADIPKGAIVYPDLDSFKALERMEEPLFDHTNLIAYENKPKVIVNNDYSRLEREIKTLAELIKRQTVQQHRDAYNAQYEAYKKSRM